MKSVAIRAETARYGAETARYGAETGRLAIGALKSDGGVFGFV